MRICSCHACDRTKLNEAGALEKSGKVNELFRAQLKARRMSEHPLTDAIRTLRGSEIVLPGRTVCVCRTCALGFGPLMMLGTILLLHQQE